MASSSMGESTTLWKFSTSAKPDEPSVTPRKTQMNWKRKRRWKASRWMWPIEMKPWPVASEGEDISECY